MIPAAASAQGSSASQTSPPDQSNKALALQVPPIAEATFGPAVGDTEIFQMILSRGSASGVTSRIARQSVCEAGASNRPADVKDFSIKASRS
jgi:hypothetical protein